MRLRVQLEHFVYGVRFGGDGTKLVVSDFVLGEQDRAPVLAHEIPLGKIGKLFFQDCYGILGWSKSFLLSHSE